MKEFDERLKSIERAANDLKELSVGAVAEVAKLGQGGPPLAAALVADQLQATLQPGRVRGREGEARHSARLD
eukprot:6207943-Pleurochrysis_carterae.AAC.2